MKKVLFVLLSVLIGVNAWGACELTDTQLENTNPGDSEYLYPDTSNFERRISNLSGQRGAYICGYGHCEHNSAYKYVNAQIGSGPKCAGECIFVCGSESGGYNGWQQFEIEPFCTVSSANDNFKYNDRLKLWEYQGKYCKELDRVKELVQVFDITNIENNTFVQQNVSVTRIYNNIVDNSQSSVFTINKKSLSQSDWKKIAKLINKTESQVQQDLQKINVRIDGLESDVQDLKYDVFMNKMVNYFQGKRLSRLERKAKKMQNQVNNRTTPDDVVKIINTEIGNFNFVNEDELEAVKNFFELQSEDVKDEIAALKRKNLKQDWKITNQGWRIAYVKWVNELRNDRQDSKIQKLGEELDKLEDSMLSESDVSKIVKQQINSVRLNKKQIKQIQSMLDGVEKKLGKRISGLEADLKDLESRLVEVEDRIDDLEKDIFWNNLQQAFRDYGQNIKIWWNGRQIKSLKDDMKDKASYDDVEKMIQETINKADLNKKQREKVKSMIDEAYSKTKKELEKQGKSIKNLERAHEKLERDVNWGITELNAKIFIETQNRKFNYWLIRNDIKKTSKNIEKVEKDLKKLADEVDEKWDEDQVMSAIEKALRGAELSDAQLELVKKLIKESADDAGARMDKIENRLNNLANAIKALQGQLLIEKMQRIAADSYLQGEIKDIDKLLNVVARKVEEKTTPEEVIELISQEVQKLSLNDKQLQQVKDLIKRATDDLDVKISNLETLLNDLGKRVEDLEKFKDSVVDELEELFANDENMLAKINELKTEIATKTTVKDVVDLITEKLAVANLNENQRAEVIKLIKEATNQLSDGQRVQVQGMIISYVDPQFSALKQDVAGNAAREVSRDKVNSAMSVLNAFAAGEDASVWKNADGKFNTARLASDATAGVVLGTAGGLISNRLIKKNQIKKGFDGISCYVGGQIVADYGDEFTVGMQ